MTPNPPTPGPMPEFDPHQLISKTRKGQLSVGEAHSLSVHVAGLEASLRNTAVLRVSEARQQHVIVALNPEGSALLVTFPGLKLHTVALPLQRPDLAMDFLTKVLRERSDKTNFVGTTGAPTNADLAALAKASKAKPKRQGETLSLEDLNL